MAKVYEHLSEEELKERYVACSNATVSRHFLVIWRLARGYCVWEVSETAALASDGSSNCSPVRTPMDQRLSAICVAASATILNPELSLSCAHDSLSRCPMAGRGRAGRSFRDADEHRIGLKPAPRRIWGPFGEGPTGMRTLEDGRRGRLPSSLPDNRPQNTRPSAASQNRKSGSCVRRRRGLWWLHQSLPEACPGECSSGTNIS
jgi:hypothetical protein